VRAGRAGPAAGAAAGAALAALVLAGCSSTGPGSDVPAGRPGAGPTAAGEPAAVEEYVALGDSYTAAPFVPVTDIAGGCLRSDANYPQRLADELGATVTDVSCGGATTADLTARQSVAGGRATVPPQLRAVGPATDLVTVGIGGNDGDLFARLATGCIGPDGRPLARCRPLGAALADAVDVVGETGQRVTQALRAVHRGAPRAVVVLVGYPRLADAARSCAGLPLSAPDRAAVVRLERLLDTSLEAAAGAGGALFADLHTASRGHEVCSADPWVNGGRSDPDRALAFHPFAAEQQAVADAVAGLVARSETARR
jgi:lysophospholipase L1-like esterase